MPSAAQRDYESMVETLYLKSSPANPARLDEAIAEAERGEGIEVAWGAESRAYKPV